MSVTRTLGLYKPTTGETGWGDNVDQGFDAVDTAITNLQNAMAGVASVGYVNGQDAYYASLAENVYNKGQSNGYAGLDGAGLVPVAQLPTVGALSQVGAPATLSGFVPGALSTAGAVLLWLPLDRDYNFAVNFAGSYVFLRTATTASLVLAINRNGAQVATLTFGAGSTVGVVNTSSAPVSYAAGEVFSLVGGGDATAADLGFAFHGTH
jgi:hypothetical protein